MSHTEYSKVHPDPDIQCLTPSTNVSGRFDVYESIVYANTEKEFFFYLEDGEQARYDGPFFLVKKGPPVKDNPKWWPFPDPFEWVKPEKLRIVKAGQLWTNFDPEVTRPQSGGI